MVEVHNPDDESRLQQALKDHCTTCPVKDLCGKKTKKGRSYEITLVKNCSLSFFRILHLEKTEEGRFKKKQRRRNPKYILPTPIFFERHSCMDCEFRPIDFTKEKPPEGMLGRCGGAFWKEHPFARNSCPQFKTRE
jgi:hypothetical protein